MLIRDGRANKNVGGILLCCSCNQALGHCTPGCKRERNNSLEYSASFALGMAQRTGWVTGCIQHRDSALGPRPIQAVVISPSGNVVGPDGYKFASRLREDFDNTPVTIAPCDACSLTAFSKHLSDEDSAQLLNDIEFLIKTTPLLEMELGELHFKPTRSRKRLVRVIESEECDAPSL